MKRMLTVLTVCALVGGTALAQGTAAEDYAKALDRENTDRDVAGALEMYKGIVGRHRSDEEIAAKSQYRIGECLEKLGKTDEAKAAYEAVPRDFPGQTALVEKAKERLAALAGQQAKESDDAEKTRLKMEKTKIDLDFVDADLADIADFLSEFSGIAILIDGQAQPPLPQKATFAVKALSITQIVKLLGSMCGFESVNRNGVLVWTSAQRAQALQARPAITLPDDAAADDRKVLTSIGSIRISLNFAETPLDTVIGFLQEVTQLNIVIAPEAGKPNLSLRVGDAKLSTALDLIGFLTDTEFAIENGAILVRKTK